MRLLKMDVYTNKHINIRPGGFSDLNLQSHVNFVFAGPCELQLHICKEFDQIPFPQVSNVGSWLVCGPRPLPPNNIWTLFKVESHFFFPREKQILT